MPVEGLSVNFFMHWLSFGKCFAGRKLFRGVHELLSCTIS